MSTPDDRPPESGDASHFDFDDLVLDEEFVRGATISEASATARVERKRQQQVRRSHRFPRPLLRRIGQRLRNRTPSNRPYDRRAKPAPEAPRVREWTTAQWAVAVVALALVAVFVWLLTGSKSAAHTVAIPATSSAAPPPGDDQVGVCRGPGTPSQTVNCANPHVLQVTGYALVSSSVQTEPSSDAAWRNLIGNACQENLGSFIGGAIPPGIQSSYIAPTAAQWSSGIHAVECTLVKPDAAGAPTLLTGSLQST